MNVIKSLGTCFKDFSRPEFITWQGSNTSTISLLISFLIFSTNPFVSSVNTLWPSWAIPKQFYLIKGSENSNSFRIFIYLLASHSSFKSVIASNLFYIFNLSSIKTANRTRIVRSYILVTVPLSKLIEY